jgi:hypothetical protein
MSTVAVSGDWLVASDGLQWILRRRKIVRGSATWIPGSFVRSTRDILARCMREKGCPPEDAQILLEAVGERFLPLRAATTPRTGERALEPVGG